MARSNDTETTARHRDDRQAGVFDAGVRGKRVGSHDQPVPGDTLSALLRLPPAALLRRRPRHSAPQQPSTAGRASVSGSVSGSPPEHSTHRRRTSPKRAHVTAPPSAPRRLPATRAAHPLVRCASPGSRRYRAAPQRCCAPREEHAWRLPPRRTARGDGTARCAPASRKARSSAGTTAAAGRGACRDAASDAAMAPPVVEGGEDASGQQARPSRWTTRHQPRFCTQLKYLATRRCSRACAARPVGVRTYVW
jgi:hypothetical protein